MSKTKEVKTKAAIIGVFLWLLVGVFLSFSGNESWQVRGYLIITVSAIGGAYLLYASKGKNEKN